MKFNVGNIYLSHVYLAVFFIQLRTHLKAWIVGDYAWGEIVEALACHFDVSSIDFSSRLRFNPIKVGFLINEIILFAYMF